MLDSAKLMHFAPGAGLVAGVAQPALDDSRWIPVSIPGDVHTALIAAGNIEDPFFGENEKECAWIEEREWWWRFHLKGPDEPAAPSPRFTRLPAERGKPGEHALKSYRPRISCSDHRDERYA